MKFKAKQTGRRTTTRVVIGGDDRDPQGIWDRILGFFSGLLMKLFGKVEVERSVEEPDQEFDFEGTPEELRVVKEASEGSLRTMIHGSLEVESASADTRKLEAGRDPREPMAGTPEEQIDAMRQLQEFLKKKEEEGYKIDFRRIAKDEEIQRTLSMTTNHLGLSVRVAKLLILARIVTVRDLVMHGEADLLLLSGFGEAALREVQDKLAELGLELGMRLPDE